MEPAELSQLKRFRFKKRPDVVWATYRKGLWYLFDKANAKTPTTVIGEDEFRQLYVPMNVGGLRLMEALENGQTDEANNQVRSPNLDVGETLPPVS